MPKAKAQDEVATAADEPRSARQYLPEKKTIPLMREAAQHCRGCDLYQNATQAVFGEGPATAKCIVIGEQPGNDEDLQGHPFVGPAGRILDRALEDAGIQRKGVYITNAVKHFKNEPRGKRRMHRSPNVAEIKACRPWLEQELQTTKARVVICMGASAARSVLGRTVTIRDVRGKFLSSDISDQILVTTHPSAILRSPDDESRHQKYDELVADLKVAAKVL